MADLDLTDGRRAGPPRGEEDRRDEDRLGVTTASDEGGASEQSGSDGRAEGSRSRASDSGPDAGSPGGMGGVRASGGTGTDRPPGGLSPMTYDRSEDKDRKS